MLPPRAQSNERSTDFYLRDFRIRSGHHGRGFALSQLQQLPVANQISHAEARHPRLPRAEELPWPTQFEIEFGDLKAVVGAHHGVETAFALFRYFAAGHQNAVRLR